MKVGMKDDSVKEKRTKRNGIDTTPLYDTKVEEGLSREDEK